MDVLNKVLRTEENFRLFSIWKSTAQSRWLVHLLKFRDRAEYSDGRETGLTGAEANALYRHEWSVAFRPQADVSFSPVPSGIPFLAWPKNFGLKSWSSSFQPRKNMLTSLPILRSLGGMCISAPALPVSS